MGAHVYFRVDEWEILKATCAFFQTAEDWQNKGRGSRKVDTTPDPPGFRHVDLSELPMQVEDESTERVVRGVLAWLAAFGQRPRVSHCHVNGVEDFEEFCMALRLVDALLTLPPVAEQFFVENAAHLNFDGTRWFERDPVRKPRFFLQIAIGDVVPMSQIMKFEGWSVRPSCGFEIPVPESEAMSDEWTDAEQVRAAEFLRHLKTHDSTDWDGFFKSVCKSGLWTLEAASRLVQNNAGSFHLDRVRENLQRPDFLGVEPILRELDRRLGVPWRGVALAGGFPFAMLRSNRTSWSDLDFFLLDDPKEAADALEVLLEVTRDWTAVAAHNEAFHATLESPSMPPEKPTPQVLTRLRSSDGLQLQIVAPTKLSLSGLLGSFDFAHVAVAMTSSSTFAIHSDAVLLEHVGSEMMKCRPEFDGTRPCDPNDHRLLYRTAKAISRGVPVNHSKNCPHRKTLEGLRASEPEAYDALSGPPRTFVLSERRRAEEERLARDRWWTKSDASVDRLWSETEEYRNAASRSWVRLDFLDGMDSVRRILSGIVVKFLPDAPVFDNLAFHHRDVPVVLTSVEPLEAMPLSLTDFYENAAVATYLAVLPNRRQKTAFEESGTGPRKKFRIHSDEATTSVSVQVVGESNSEWPARATLDLSFVASFLSVRDRLYWMNYPEQARQKKLPESLKARTLQVRPLRFYLFEELQPVSTTLRFSLQSREISNLLPSGVGDVE